MLCWISLLRSAYLNDLKFTTSANSRYRWVLRYRLVTTKKPDELNFSCGFEHHNGILTCGCKYIIRTASTFCTRFAERIPRWLQKKKIGVPKSAITEHLDDIKHAVDRQKAFSILHRTKSKKSLAFVQSITIQRLAPNLCIPREMLAGLKLGWW